MPSFSIASGDADTFLDANYPDINWGARADIYVGWLSKTIQYRAAIKVDAAAVLPAGATILTATLAMACGNIVGSKPYVGVRVRRDVPFAQKLWVESEATWNIYKAGSNWNTPGCKHTTYDIDPSVAFGPWTVASPAGWKSVDIATFLQDAVDNRIRVFDACLYPNWTPADENDVGYHSFKSKDFDDSDYHWYITGTYGEAPPGGSRNWGTVIGSKLGGVHLPNLPRGWQRRGLQGLLVPGGC